MPFRKAHHLVGALVGEAQKTGRSLKAVAADRLKDASPSVASRLDSIFEPLEAVRSKALAGGTAPDAVRASLAAALARVGGTAS